MILKENVPLAEFTTFNIGGPARYFVEAETVEEIIEALAFARANSLEVFVLGGGSNIVVSDSGFNGLVLAPRITGIDKKSDGNRVTVTVGAGVVWDDFVIWAIDNGFAGLECMSGVPGTVGGAVVANIGAYGAQCSDTFFHARVIDCKNESNEVMIMEKKDCNFSYHDSIFDRDSGRYIVIDATFSLTTDPIMAPAYRDNRFDMTGLSAVLGHEPSIGEIRKFILDTREAKGSLMMKGRISYRCAGSFFHMPFVSREKYEKITELAAKLDSEKEKSLRPWAWEQKDGSYKIAPGFLLEYTEFQKGYTRGSVGISPKHTLSIINIACANAKDVANLARDMRESVEKLFEIRFEREVKYVGNIENNF
jgi:UDP-N-acetylmuramate dehydrogenase